MRIPSGTAAPGGDPSADGTSPVVIDPLPVHRIDTAALSAWLGAVLPEAEAGLTVQQFQGGMSNPTYLLTAASGTRYVLRKKPPGKLLAKAHAVDREHRVMQALAGTAVPVPRMIACCEDAGVIGTAFFVMEHVAGRIMTAPAMDAVPPAERPRLAFSLVDTMARLHRVDWRGAGLEGFGRPEGYLARQTARWAAQVEASKPALPAETDYAELDWLRDWLGDHAAIADESAITHGDFRLGNTVVDPDRPEVIAVLDWELSTIGHPIADLAYFCLHHGMSGWRMSGGGMSGGAGPDTAPSVSGLPSEDAVLARYCETVGRDGVPDWPVFLAFSCFRSAAIIQGVAARAAQGNVSSASADPVRDTARALQLAAAGAAIARGMDRRG